MTRVGSVLGFLAFALAQASCSVDDVDYAGKLCNADTPCPGSYSCTNGACCTPRFSVEGFSLDWKTSNTLRFRWTPPANAEQDFVQYLLVIGKTDAELRAAEAQARADAGQNDPAGGAIRTADDNPELAQYKLRLSGDFDVVAATIADELEPATEYRARLLAFDTSGCASVTQTVVARTDQDSSLEYVMFDDGPHPGGEPRPYDGMATFATDATKAFEDGVYIDWPGPDVDGTYELIGVAQLNARMEDDFPSLDFSTAFVEAAVAFDGNPLAVWGEARILLGQTDCGDNDAFQFSPYAFRSGGAYRVIQIPLSRLFFDEKNLTLATLAARPVCEFSVGQSLAAGQGVRVDSVRLRW